MPLGLCPLLLASVLLCKPDKCSLSTLSCHWHMEIFQRPALAKLCKTNLSVFSLNCPSSGFCWIHKKESSISMKCCSTHNSQKNQSTTPRGIMFPRWSPQIVQLRHVGNHKSCLHKLLQVFANHCHFVAKLYAKVLRHFPLYDVFTLVPVSHSFNSWSSCDLCA